MKDLAGFYAGRTVVIVAHRLSTVRNADMIVVLDHGTVQESGTHQELVQNKGAYYRLIRDQLELGQ
jgi:ATP-binding cassette subfamily B protein